MTPGAQLLVGAGVVVGAKVASATDDKEASRWDWRDARCGRSPEAQAQRLERGAPDARLLPPTW